MTGQTENKVEDIKDDLNDIKTEIVETPKEDKDKEWQTEMMSRLTTLLDQVKTLSEAQMGADPEISALQNQLDKISNQLTTLEKQQTALPLVSPKSPEEDNPIQETPKETLSAPMDQKVQETKKKNWY